MNWIKTTEKSPNPYYSVLICESDGSISIAYITGGGLWEYRDTFDKVECVTHWQPLPDMPEEKDYESA